MKVFNYTLIIIISLIFSCCLNDQSKTDNLLKYSILKENIDDIPIKAQVELFVLIEDTAITEQSVRDLLNHLYNKTIRRKGFRYHKNPTSIYIYTFTTKEKAESGMGQWVGMISKSHADNNPKITINEIQLNAIKEFSTDRWELTHKQRQKIWEKSILAEDKAQNEVDLKYPIDKPGITNDDMINNADLMRKLSEKYKNEIAKEYNIDKAIIDSIGIEGAIKGWAFPK
jgi:hypothetical protein